MTIEEVLKKHRRDVLYEDEYKVYPITVRRGNILEDTMFALRRNFDSKKHIRIRFIGEPAVGAGGPRREFFMLLLNEIGNNGSLLQGPPDRRLLRHNTSAFQVKRIIDDLHACICSTGYLLPFPGRAVSLCGPDDSPIHPPWWPRACIVRNCGH